MTDVQPIIFSGDMVNAILQNRKSQTRRIVRPQPRWSETHGWLRSCGRGKYDSNKRLEQHFEKSADGSEKILHQREYELPVEEWLMTFCRFEAGMRLWVRESFSYPFPLDVECKNFTGFYRASDPDRKVKWRSSIHMPRWASRLTLEVTAVGVERLQSIDELDALAEGVEGERIIRGKMVAGGESVTQDWIDGSCRDGYAALWDSIHGAGSWDANPWVWKIEFRKVEP